MGDIKKYICTWSDSGTTKEGKFAQPRACIAKKCSGGPFRKMPDCSMFMDMGEAKALYEQQLGELGPKERAYSRVDKIALKPEEVGAEAKV